MRHLQSGRKLGVDSSHRIALLRSLTLALIEHEKIKTTPARAKELRWYAERVVTLAKRGNVASRRHMIKLLGSTQTYVTGSNRVRNAVERVYTLLVPRFAGRNGGYTRIIRLANRRAGDNAEMCLMQYLPDPSEDKGKGPKGKKAKGKASKKSAAAASEKSEKKADKKESKKEHHSHAEDKGSKGKKEA